MFTSQELFVISNECVKARMQYEWKQEKATDIIQLQEKINQNNWNLSAEEWNLLLLIVEGVMDSEPKRRVIEKIQARV